MKPTKIIFVILFVSITFMFGCKLFQSNSNDAEEYFPILEVEANTCYELGYAICYMDFFVKSLQSRTPQVV